VIDLSFFRPEADGSISVLPDISAWIRSRIGIWFMFGFWMLRTLILPALSSGLLVLLTIRVSQRYDIMARPTSRGVHSQPTPRLGGVGAGAAFFILAALLPMWYGPHLAPVNNWFAALILGGAWALVGGALDDVYELPPRWKLLLQLAAAFSPWAVGYAPQNFSVPILGNFHMPPIVGSVLCFLFIMLMMNVVNFMDGMDGHAALFGLMTSCALVAMLIISRSFVERFMICSLGLGLAGSQLGLLAYNLPGRPVHTKTFMGDSGSQFLGYCLAMLAMAAADGPERSRFPLLGSLLLFSPFVYDVGYTAFKRWRRGEDLRHAHKEHLYQRLMVAGWSHGRTLAVNALFLWLAVILLALSYGIVAFGPLPEWMLDLLGESINGIFQLFLILVAALLLWYYTSFVRRVESAEKAHRQLAGA
jgi:UDP-GlcNAc:undecaprenyl-phosphate/decaprenyl-phosphate GlcNAc-1-phosphate transferase